MEQKNIKKMQNPMREIRIDSVTLHCSTADPAKLERSFKLLKVITGKTPVKTITRKRIPTFKIRPGLEIGCKVTLRKEKAIEVLRAILMGIPKLNKKQFCPGYFAFGIKEYIEIPSIPYQRDVGMLGFEVMIALKRKGFRIARRKLKTRSIGSRHKISKDETIEFFKQNFKTPVD